MTPGSLDACTIKLGEKLSRETVCNRTMPSLPFSTIEDSELDGVRSGPLIALFCAAKKSGPVTIRSFISIHMLAIYSNTTASRKLHCWPDEEGSTHVQAERCSRLRSSVSETTCRVATTRTRLLSSDTNNLKTLYRFSSTCTLSTSTISR